MKKVLLTCVLMGYTVSSFAEEKVMVAYCQVKQGCEAYLSDLTYEEADLLLDYLGTAKKNQGATLVMMENNYKEWAHYFDKQRDLKQLNEYFGGQGQPVIRLFPRVHSNDIQPQDGFWIINSTAPQATGCPAGVAEQASKQTFAQGGQVKFSQPFKASDMLNHPGIKWLKIKPNAYKAKIFQTGNPQAVLSAVYDIQLVNAKLIKGKTTSRINVKPFANCKIVQDFTYTRKAG